MIMYGKAKIKGSSNLLNHALKPIGIMLRLKTSFKRFVFRLDSSARSNKRNNVLKVSLCPFLNKTRENQLVVFLIRTINLYLKQPQQPTLVLHKISNLAKL